MPGKTNISWTEATLNPTVGCTQVSDGCTNCYALTLHTNRHEAWKAGKFPDAPPQYHRPFSEVQLIPERLDIPLRWTKPRLVFVNSVSDLFHADVPTAFIDRMVAVFALASQHTFQVLTKRPQRMQRYFSDPELYGRILDAATGFRAQYPKLVSVPISDPAKFPLPNLWLGTSVENQEAAYRLDALVKTPAAVRFVSAEPLLGPLCLSKWLYLRDGYDGDIDIDCPVDDIHWVITGGESGPGHRPADVAWFRSLADQCADAGVSFFMKQDSGHRSGHQGRILDDLWALKQMPEVGR